MTKRGITLKPRHIKALRWFAERESAHLFGAGDPAMATVRHLHAVDLVETCGTALNRGPFGFTKYRISELGRRALKGTP